MSPFDALVRDLGSADAYPDVASVHVIHTHASVVFLAGGDVYKVKKPVDLGFLDYSTLDARRRFTELEVAINRRLAPDVYLGVVPVVRGPDGVHRIGGEGEIVDQAVHMRRLDDGDNLRAAALMGTLSLEECERVGRRLAAIHDDAPRPAVARRPVEETVDQIRDNLTALASVDWLDQRLLMELHTRTEQALAEHQPTMRERQELHCAIHGDLRLEHVYRNGAGYAFIDAIEFDVALRHGDPLSDIAFLVMDMRSQGSWQGAEVLFDTWAAERDDGTARSLLPLYVSYRAAVRAKVASIRAEVPQCETDRQAARDDAMRHLRLALHVLRPPSLRTRLVLMSGLPGTGKSTVARRLERLHGWPIVRSDVCRKQLVDLDPTTSCASAPDRGMYGPAWNRYTYSACLLAARDHLVEGQTVIVDAGFRTHGSRQPFIDLARRQGVPVQIVVCTAPEDEVLRRIEARRGDASDADAAIYRHLADRWQDPADTVLSLAVDTTSVMDVRRVGDALLGRTDARTSAAEARRPTRNVGPPSQ